MKPIKREKQEKKNRVIEIIKILDHKGYTNIQISEILGVHITRTSALRNHADEYSISLNSLKAMLERGEQFLETMEK